MPDVALDPIEKSCFFRLKSPYKLAELLKITQPQLKGLCSDSNGNYEQFESGDRWIETPRTLLKKVQRRIHELLVRIPPPDFLSSAYRGRSAITNAAVHRDGGFFAKLDIRGFYRSSRGSLIYDLFRDTFQCSPCVATYLRKLCSISGTINANRAHLPTGGVTSPILAYFCYRQMFLELEAFARERGLKYSVFADDITFSGPSGDHSIISAAKVT